MSIPALLTGAGLAALFAFPWVFTGAGIGQLPVLAGIVAWRALLTAALSLALAVLVAVAFLVRPLRRSALGLVIPLVPLAAVAVGTLLAPVPVSERASGSENVMSVLSWNVNGSLVDAPTLEREVTAHRPDVVVLPSIDDDVLGPAARALAAEGYTLIRPAGSETAILTSREYAPFSLGAYGPERTSEAIAEAANGRFRIVAVHLRIPFLPSGDAAWNREARWLGEICRAKTPGIIVGDFNATDDNLAGTSLASCADAAAAAGAQHVGTWPAQIPPALGMPIDHLVISGDAAKVLRFDVLRDQDDSGTRHRPILVTLARETE